MDDLDSFKWITRALKNGYYITEPYRWETNKLLTFSISIKIENISVGVVGTDLSSEFLYKDILSSEFDKNSFYMILNPNNKCIIGNEDIENKRLSQIFSENFEKQFNKNTNQESNSFLINDLDNKYGYTKLKNGWSILKIENTKTYTNIIIDKLKQIIPYILGLILISIFINYSISKKYDETYL